MPNVGRSPAVRPCPDNEGRMTAMVDEFKTEGGFARVIAAVLVGAAGAFGYVAGWLSPNHAPPSLVFSRGGDQVAKQRVAQINPEEPYAPASG